VNKVNIDEFIKYLEEKGFNEKQINQLVKIQESGYDFMKYYSCLYGIDIEIIEDKCIKPEDDIKKLRELKNILINNNFNNEQLTVVVEGYKDNIDYELYAKIEYNNNQMLEIKNGLNSKIDIKKYADIKYDEDQMYQIRLGLLNNVDITNYCNYNYNANKMVEIRLGLENKLDVMNYNNTEYSWRQMQQIRLGLEYKLDVTKYNDIKYNYKQMFQIRYGLTNKVDVTKYNDIKYNDGQMEVLREILEYNKKNKKEQIDITLFQNSKIQSYAMSILFDNLKSNDQDLIIETYRELNEYNNKDNNINNELER
jgi:hypothetical protein